MEEPKIEIKNKVAYGSINQILKSEKYPFTLGQMRDFMQKKYTNGLHIAVRKIGHRLYIRLDLFDEWIENGGKL